MRFHIVPELFVLDSCVAERDVMLNKDYPSEAIRPAARTFGTQLSRGAALPTTSMVVGSCIAGPWPINADKLPHRERHRLTGKKLESPVVVATYDDRYLIAALAETYCRDDYSFPGKFSATNEPYVTHGYRGNPITLLGMDQMDDSLTLKANKKLLPIYIGADAKRRPKWTRDASTGKLADESGGGSWKQKDNLAARFCDGRGFTSRNSGARSTVNGINNRSPGSRIGSWPYHDTVTKNGDDTGTATHWGVVECGQYAGNQFSYWYANDPAPSSWDGMSFFKNIATADYSSATETSFPQTALKAVYEQAEVDATHHIGESETFSRKNLRGSLIYTMAYTTEAREHTFTFAPYLASLSLTELYMFAGYVVDGVESLNMTTKVASLRRHMQQRAAQEMTTRSLYLAGTMATAMGSVMAAEMAGRAHLRTWVGGAPMAELYKTDDDAGSTTCANTLRGFRNVLGLPRWLNIARAFGDWSCTPIDAQSTGYRKFNYATLDAYDNAVDNTAAIPLTPWNFGNTSAVSWASALPEYSTPGTGELVVAPHWTRATRELGPEEDGAVSCLRTGYTGIGILLDPVLCGNQNDYEGCYLGDPKALSFAIANAQSKPITMNGNVVTIDSAVYGTSPNAALSVYDSRASGTATWASTLRAPLVDSDHIVMANGAIRRADAMMGYAFLMSNGTAEYKAKIDTGMAGHSPVLLATKALFAAAGGLNLYVGQAPQHNIWTGGGWYMGTINPGAQGTHHNEYYEGDLDG